MLDNPENKAILAKTITVEGSPRQAEHIAVAGEMGRISIALRSLAQVAKKDETAEALSQVVSKTAEAPEPATDAAGNPIKALYGDDTGYTRDSDLSQMLDRKSLSVPRVQVLRGDKSETIDFLGAQ
jgi:hypothetical protein